MTKILAFAAALLAVIGVGVGAMAASGHASLATAKSSGPADPLAASGNHGRRTSQATQPAVLPVSDLCGEIGSISGGSIVRELVITQNHLRFTFPRVVAFPSTSAARRAARLICSLPPQPPGVMFCPVDLGVVYQIRFDIRSTVASVDADPWGCRGVSGLRSARWAETVPTFWSVLGTTIGLSGASDSTFQGSLPPQG